MDEELAHFVVFVTSCPPHCSHPIIAPCISVCSCLSQILHSLQVPLISCHHHCSPSIIAPCINVCSLLSKILHSLQVPIISCPHHCSLPIIAPDIQVCAPVHQLSALPQVTIIGCPMESCTAILITMVHIIRHPGDKTVNYCDNVEDIMAAWPRLFIYKDILSYL